MHKTIFIAVFSLLIFIGKVFAQSESSSFLFLLIGSGSRAAAMSEAYTAVEGDAGAPYFNPALASTIQRTELSLMHVEYLSDASMEHFSVVTRTGKMRLGLGLYLGQTSDIERRGPDPSGEPLGTFDDHNFTISALWAYPFTNRIGFGTAIKWSYQKLDIESASALAGDLGASYHLLPELTFAAAIRNLGTRPKFIDKPFDLPREFRIGMAFRPLIDSRFRGIILAGDIVLPHWGNKSIKINLGGEYTYQNTFSIRTGYGINYDSRGFSIGGGLKYRIYLFDYAYIPSKNELDDTHRLTLRIQL